MLGYETRPGTDDGGAPPPFGSSSIDIVAGRLVVADDCDSESISSPGRVLEVFFNDGVDGDLVDALLRPVGAIVGKSSSRHVLRSSGSSVASETGVVLGGPKHPGIADDETATPAAASIWNAAAAAAADGLTPIAGGWAADGPTADISVSGGGGGIPVAAAAAAAAKNGDKKIDAGPVAAGLRINSVGLPVESNAGGGGSELIAFPVPGGHSVNGWRIAAPLSATGSRGLTDEHPGLRSIERRRRRLVGRLLV